MAILWIIDHSLEIIATIAGLLYIIYSVEQEILCWPYGIVSSAIYVYVFYISGIFADMALYVYYVIIGFYGWYNWLHGRKNPDNRQLPVRKINFKTGITLFIITSVLFIVISYILRNYTSSNIPYWDAFTTALSITATWMLTQKIMEHWIIWVIVDSMSAGLYLYKELYPSIILFAVYTILAVIGYIDWHKEWKNQQISTI